MRIYFLILLSLTFLYGQDDCTDSNVICGCTDSTACDYNPEATLETGCFTNDDDTYSNCDDGTTGCDCNNDCGGSTSLDDCGNCSGTNTYNAAMDECGVCDGNGLGTGTYFTGCWDLIEYCYSDLLTCENQSEAVDCNSLDYCPFNPEDCEDGTIGCECIDESNIDNYSQVYIEFCGESAGSDGCYGPFYEDTCVPTDFSSVFLSSKQAFYYIESVTIDGAQVEADDWVGAFNGNVCVGARQWDTSECGGGVCAVPVMGVDFLLPEETEGYIQPGETPAFQIYDASANMYYDAQVSDDISWTDQALEQIYELKYENPLSIYDQITPDTYSIYNIYPNPFNPITNIEYSLLENAYIELFVYNIHGKHIQTLVQGFQTAGYHSINWNASNYPSGIYFIRLESGAYSKTQKVVLFK